MFRAVVRKWGNSMGIVIPKEVAKKLQEGQEVNIDIITKNPLEELYYAKKEGKITQEFLKKHRKEFQVSKWF